MYSAINVGVGRVTSTGASSNLSSLWWDCVGQPAWILLTCCSSVSAEVLIPAIPNVFWLSYTQTFLSVIITLTTKHKVSTCNGALLPRLSSCSQLLVFCWRMQRVMHYLARCCVALSTRPMVVLIRSPIPWAEMPLLSRSNGHNLVYTLRFRWEIYATVETAHRVESTR